MSAQSRTASVRKKEHRFSTIALERVTKALGSFEDDASYANEADGEEKFPPADRGKKALLFMCSAFAIEAIMWGFPLTCAGVFASYYSKSVPFHDNRYIAVIGTLGTGIPFLGAPLITPLTARWHRYQRHMIWTGWATCVLSLVAASFSTNVWHLILTQGFGYGCGFLILYYAMLSMMNEWFVQRRGLAYGILFAAAGLSGVGLPFLTQWLLERYGYATTLRVYALIIFILIGPTLPLCRGRYPPGAVAKWNHIEFRSVLTSPIFYCFTVSNVFQGLAFYLPGIYLALFANAIGVPAIRTVLLLSLLNLAQVIGQIALGWMSDCSDIFVLLTVSTVGSIVACAFWYSAFGMGYLAIFAVMYGMCAGSYTVLFSRFVSSLTMDPPTSLWLYGIFAFQRGLGSVASGPLSAFLLKQMDPSDSDDYRGSYRSLILFVGGCLAASLLGGFGYYIRHRAIEPMPERLRNG